MRKSYYVEVEGDIFVSIFGKYGHLAESRSLLEIHKVVSFKSSGSRMQLPKFDADSKFIDQGKSLITINNMYIQSLYGGNQGQPNEVVLLDKSFAIVNNNGKVIDGNLFSNQEKIEKIISINNSILDISKTKSDYIVEGIVNVKMKDGEEQLHYKNIFHWKDTFWKLSKTVVIKLQLNNAG